MKQLIGETAKQFGISKRTLRYWEDRGILSSIREENGYRFYDGENLSRIGFIVVLRHLSVPILEIERVLHSNDIAVAVLVLKEHLDALRREGAQIEVTAEKLKHLIAEIKSYDNLTALFSSGIPEENSVLPLRADALKTTLSGKGITMNKLNNVRIVQLPAMKVVRYRAESDTPEHDASAVMNPFILEHGLDKRSGFRHFGFNSPSPTEGNPVYGYEIWVSVPDDFAAEPPFEVTCVPGGLYASISTGMGEIGERWKALARWVEESDKYALALKERQWLEECVDFESFLNHADDMQLDLLEPIKLK